MPKPPSWTQIESSERYGSLSPEEKQQVVTKWKEDSIGYGKSIGGFSEKHEAAINQFASGRISEITEEAPKILPPPEIKSEFQPSQSEIKTTGELISGAIETVSKPSLDLMGTIGVDSQTLADAVDVVAATAGLAHGTYTPADFFEKLAEPSRDPSTIEKTIAGGQQAIIGTAEFFTSPLGAATLGMGALPSAAQKTVAGLFVADMAYHAPDQVNALAEAIVAKDEESISREATGLALTGAFIFQGGKHALAKKKSPAQAVAEMMNEYVKAAKLPEGKIVGESKVLLEPANLVERQSLIDTANKVSGPEALKLMAAKVGEKVNPVEQAELAKTPKIIRAEAMPQETRLKQTGIPEEKGDLKTAEELALDKVWAKPEYSPEAQYREATGRAETAPELEIISSSKPMAGRIMHRVRASGIGEETTVTTKEGATVEEIKSAWEKNQEAVIDAEPSAQALGITPKPSAGAVKAASEVTRLGMGPFRVYSERLADTLTRMGGKASAEFANVTRKIGDLAKEKFGTISQELDVALEATGSRNKTTKFLNGIKKHGNWGVGNMFRLEDPRVKARLSGEMKDTVKKLDAANEKIGALILGEHITGKYQRMPTPLFIDIIRQGRGTAYDTVVGAIAELNGIKRSSVKSTFAELKKELDAPGLDPQTVRRVSQEFNRVYEKMPTHIKQFGQWTEIIHSKPFEYLQEAARRVSNRAAFKEWFPEEGEGVRKLSEVREDVVSELKGQPQHFDRIIRALHGLPVDDPVAYKMGLEPGGFIDLYARKPINEALGSIPASLKLSASALVNSVELVSGNTPQLFGVARYLRGLAKLTSKEQRIELERIGAINKLIYDFSTDPNHPIYTEARNFRQLVRKGSMANFLNEIQEKAAASTALVFASDAKAGKLSKTAKADMYQSALEMGFEKAEAKRLSDGTASDASYQSFIVRSPAYLTGGNIHPSELSRFGASRTATSMVRFQSYPMMKMNVARQLANRWAEAAASGNAKEFYHANRRLARFIAGTTGQGVGAVLLSAMVKGGWDGVEVALNEAKDEPVKFAKDALLNGIGGPMQMIGYLGENTDRIAQSAVRSILPANSAYEVWAVSTGNGKYKDMELIDRMAKYATEDVPGSRVAIGGAAMVGLAERDNKLNAALGGLSRWKRDEFGVKYLVSNLKEDKREPFRIEMKKAVEAIQKGKPYSQYLINAVKLENHPEIKMDKKTGAITISANGAQAVAQSLRSRKRLKNIDGGELTPEQIGSLKKRIGDEYYNRLVSYDTLLDTLATVITTAQPQP